ncbi:NAD-dependent epimerase/dehydratase family protein [Sporichthya polymorpha]|uniref:NAD-dependent epimerase/dehydratase family protein n=1 Tax=Sporichthya polymorpha TaxID=35751 RepID=UPI00035DF39C|nr:NAD(P)-dependent oxidoreductase [Sporichthya polymorpha]
MSRLLVTGGSGFVGSACIRAAIERGHEVHVVSRAGRPVPDGAMLHPWDLLTGRPVDLMEQVRPTHLVHLAWIATPGVYWTSPENLAWVRASLELLETFAAAGGRRAVFAGTCAEYDWTGDGVLREDSTPLRPATPYGAAKVALGSAAATTAKRLGIELVWARLFFLYGPGEHPDRLVPHVTRQLLRGHRADCTDGTQIRDFLHVDDAADAMMTVLESRFSGAVNIASGTGVEVRTVVRHLAEMTGGQDLLRLGARPSATNDPARLVGDVSVLVDQVGWQPRIPLTVGLELAVEWWRKHDELRDE